MTEFNITIDINKLNTEELELLKKITYAYGQMEETKNINNRIAFLKGWTDKEN